MKRNVDHPAYVLAYAAVASGVFTAAIMAVHVAARPRIELNERAFDQRALVGLFADRLGLGDAGALDGAALADAYRRHIRRDLRITDAAGQPIDVIRAVARGADGNDKLLGYAIPVSGIGFWARIDGYLAVTPDWRQVVGITFVRHSETPGLGGRLTEKAWRDAFVGLTITPPTTGGTFIHVGPAGPAGRRVDAITGATGTSKAIERFLNADLGRARRAAVAAGLIETP